MKQINKNLKDLYKTTAKDFYKFSLDSFPWQFIEEPALRKILHNKIKSDFKAFDVGCGGGRIINLLLKLGIKKKNIIGLDSSKSMLEIAREKHPEINFINNDISKKKLELSNFNHFDLITCVHTFEHLNQKQLEQSLKNIFNTTKDNGILIYLVGHPIRYVDLEKYSRKHWRKQGTPWGDVIDHYHRSISDYINATIDVGFTILHIEEPIVSGKGRKNIKKYKNYSLKPSRLLICAIKK